MPPADSRRCGGGRRNLEEDPLSSSSYDFSPDDDDDDERSFDLSPPLASRDAFALLLLLHDGQGQQDVQQLVACPMVSVGTVCSVSGAAVASDRFGAALGACRIDEARVREK